MEPLPSRDDLAKKLKARRLTARIEKWEAEAQSLEAIGGELNLERAASIREGIDADAQELQKLKADT